MRLGLTYLELLTVWALPIIAVGIAFGWDSIFVDQGLFFSGATAGGKQFAAANWGVTAYGVCW